MQVIVVTSIILLHPMDNSSIHHRLTYLCYLEEANKLYNKLSKELVDETVCWLAHDVPISLLSQADEREQQPNPDGHPLQGHSWDTG